MAKKAKPITKYVREFWTRSPETRVKPSGKLYRRSKNKAQNPE